MYKTLFASLVVGSVGLSSLGCSQSTGVQEKAAATPAIDGSRFLLPTEPAGAVGVMKAREEAQDAEPIVIAGRIGGVVKPWIEGRSAFMLVDAAASDSCDEACDEHCACSAEELAGASTLVKFVDEQGQTLPVDARDLLGVKELQIVVVRGTAKRDESNNLVVMADGIYIRR